jgi:hypothetical protein
MNTPPCLSQSFLSYIQSANGIAAPLQPSDWLRLAIRSSAGAGNPRGSILTLSLAAITEIETLIGELSEKLESEPAQTQANFDRHFLDGIGEVIRVVASLSPGTAFSFGRAQKILTIYLKYAYACSRLKSEAPAMVTGWRRFFHIPVDRQTLLYFYRQPAHRSLALLSNGRLVSWKWGLDEARYMKIQSAARSLVSKMKLSDPLHFEMARIWTQPSRRTHPPSDDCLKGSVALFVWTAPPDQEPSS